MGSRGRGYGAEFGDWYSPMPICSRKAGRPGKWALEYAPFHITAELSKGTKPSFSISSSRSPRTSTCPLSELVGLRQRLEAKAVAEKCSLTELVERLLKTALEDAHG